MKKILALFLILFGPLNTVNASSPFDIIRSSYPDFIVSDIWQNINSKDLYIKVCNIGGSMNENGTLTIGARINSSNIISNIIQNINLDSNSCGSYQLASIKDFSIITSGNYELKVGVLMKESRTERIKSNNSLKKTIYINYNNTNNNIPSNYPYINFPYSKNDYILYEPDLVTDSIWQDRYNILNVKICNIGYSMNNFENTYIVIYNGNFNSIKSFNLKLNKGECIISTVNLGEISIYSNGNYTIKVSANAYKNITELNQNNNSLSKNLYLRVY